MGRMQVSQAEVGRVNLRKQVVQKVIGAVGVGVGGGQQNRQFAMQEGGRSAIEAVNPLIKLVKEREELYFELFSFVNKHIGSSSNDLDSLTIFNKFLAHVHAQHLSLSSRERLFLQPFAHPHPDPDHPPDDPLSKEMLRLSSRLIEMLDTSMARVRNSIFEEGGRADKEFLRFKLQLNKILKREPLAVADYAQCILSFTGNKFHRQLARIQKYVGKVELGEDIYLRELYCKDNSDVEVSPDERRRGEKKTLRKPEGRVGESAQQQKKVLVGVVRKAGKSSLKRRQRPLNIKNRAREQELNQLQCKPNKEQAANKLLKFYNLLELNKKEFLEDYVYDQLEQQKHQQELLIKLIERNKPINTQINNYVRKTAICLPPPLILNKSSGDQRADSGASKVSLRTSFVISKRKPSFHLESSSGTDNKNSDNEHPAPFERTIKNYNPRRRSSHSTHRPESKSKKLFVVKAPMVFEDDVIPQVQITQTQWLQASKGKERKNQNIRLKKKNNPNPMDNAFLPETFRYPL